MSLLFAHLEHQARQFAASAGRVLAEKCSGFSQSAAVEFLFGPEPTARQLPANEPCDWQRDLSSVPAEDHRGYYEATTTCGQESGIHGCYCIPGHASDDHGCLCGHVWSTADRAEEARERLVAREAEEEVAEPRTMHCALCGLNITAVAFHACPLRDQQAIGRTYSLDEVMRLRDAAYDECGRCGWLRREHNRPFAHIDVCTLFVEPKTSAGPTPSAEDDPAGFPEPAGSPTVPAGVSAGLPTTAPPAGLPTPGEFAAVAVCEVLADHYFWRANHSSIGSEAHCACGDRPHGQFEWREHVAAEVQRRIDAATNSQAQQPK